LIVNIESLNYPIHFCWDSIEDRSRISANISILPSHRNAAVCWQIFKVRVVNRSATRVVTGDKDPVVLDKKQSLELIEARAIKSLLDLPHVRWQCRHDVLVDFVLDICDEADVVLILIVCKPVVKDEAGRIGFSLRINPDDWLDLRYYPSTPELFMGARPDREEGAAIFALAWWRFCEVCRRCRASDDV